MAIPISNLPHIDIQRHSSINTKPIQTNSLSEVTPSDPSISNKIKSQIQTAVKSIFSFVQKKITFLNSTNKIQNKSTQTTPPSIKFEMTETDSIKHNELKNKIQTSSKNFQTLKSSYKQTTDKRTKLLSEQKTLESSFDTIKTSLDSLNQKKKDIELKLRNDKQTYDLSQPELTKQKEENQTSFNNFQTLNSSYEQTTTEITKLLNKKKDLKSSFDNNISSIEKSLVSLTKQEKDTNLKLEKAKKVSDQSKNKLTQLQEKTQSYINNFQTLKSSYKQTTTETTKLLSEQKNLESSFNTNKTSLDSLNQNKKDIELKLRNEKQTYDLSQHELTQLQEKYLTKTSKTTEKTDSTTIEHKPHEDEENNTDEMLEITENTAEGIGILNEVNLEELEHSESGIEATEHSGAEITENSEAPEHSGTEGTENSEAPEHSGAESAENSHAESTQSHESHDPEHLESTIHALEIATMASSGLGTLLSAKETAELAIEKKKLTNELNLLKKDPQKNSQKITELSNKLSELNKKLTFSAAETTLKAGKTSAIGVAKFAAVSAVGATAAIGTSAGVTGLFTVFSTKSVAVNRLTTQRVNLSTQSVSVDSDLSQIKQSLNKKSNKVLQGKLTGVASGAAATVGLGLLAAGLVSNPVGWTIMGAGIIGIGAMAIRHYQKNRHANKINTAKSALNNLQKQTALKKNQTISLSVPRKVADKIEGKKPTFLSWLTAKNTRTISVTQNNIESIKTELNHDLSTRDESQVHTKLTSLYNTYSNEKKDVLVSWLAKASGTSTSFTEQSLKQDPNISGKTSSTELLMHRLEGNIYQ